MKDSLPHRFTLRRPPAAPPVVDRADVLARSVVMQVATHFGVSETDVVSRCRRRDLAWTRHVAAWVLRDLGYSYPAVAKALAREDHTTVMASVKRVEKIPSLKRDAVILAGLARQTKQDLYSHPNSGDTA